MTLQGIRHFVSLLCLLFDHEASPYNPAVLLMLFQRIGGATLSLVRLSCWPLTGP